MSLICDYCGRDLDAIRQDNVSFVPGTVICEDCARPEAAQEGGREAERGGGGAEHDG